MARVFYAAVLGQPTQPCRSPWTSIHPALPGPYGGPRVSCLCSRDHGGPARGGPGASHEPPPVPAHLGQSDRLPCLPRWLWAGPGLPARALPGCGWADSRGRPLAEDPEARPEEASPRLGWGRCFPAPPCLCGTTGPGFAVGPGHRGSRGRQRWGRRPAGPWVRAPPPGTAREGGPVMRWHQPSDGSVTASALAASLWDLRRCAV